MPAVTITIGVATCAKFITEYLGLIESAAINTSKLRHEPLKSAIAWFKNAKNCSDVAIMKTYLNDARRDFMKAISLEQNENKVAAILGLSMCQLLLGDRVNANRNIQEINDVRLSVVEITKRALKRQPNGVSELVLWATPVGRNMLRTRWIMSEEENFETYKEDVMAFNRKLIEAC